MQEEKSKRWTQKTGRPWGGSKGVLPRSRRKTMKWDGNKNKREGQWKFRGRMDLRGKNKEARFVCQNEWCRPLNPKKKTARSRYGPGTGKCIKSGKMPFRIRWPIRRKSGGNSSSTCSGNPPLLTEVPLWE